MAPRKMVFVAAMWLMVAGCASKAEPPAMFGAVPTPAQLAWHRAELAMFLHFGVNTFTDREWGEGTESPSIFNPTKLDARQWARIARENGFKTVILTAKHHDGFCLWPSKYTDHSVKSSPWKGGKGDVVRELADACKAEGLKLGLYLSPWDRHERTYGDSPKYNEYYRNQLTELLTQYGDVVEVWFDGACGEGPNGKRQEYDWTAVHALVRDLQPGAVMFSDAGPDVRWIGNERGTAGDPCWATVDPKIWVAPGKSADGVRDAIKYLQHGDRGGSVWRPGESDVSIRPGWFWHKKEDDKVRSVENLLDLYFKSVGRNSVLLLNVPPNTDGLISEADAKALAGFHTRLERIFKTNLAAGAKATASNVRGNEAAYAPGRALDGKFETYWATDDNITSASIEIDLGRPTKFNILRIQENIALGQRVEQYRLEYLDGGEWKPVARGTTIGHKKLDRFEPITAQRVRLTIEKALACPVISTIGLFLDE